ncbi:MAG: DUF6198 family protein [Erysipelotrichaceae bacterium]|nr:DUF6198 family protein [Erysipelotrichaceae bacterium]
MKRYIYFIIGLALSSFGTVLVTKGNLGTSQISSVPYVMNLEYPVLSFGLWTFIWNMLFIMIQIFLLRKDFKPIQFLQIIANIIFSVLIDVSDVCLSWLNADNMMIRIVYLILGCMVLAFGITVEVAPNVIVVPGEGIVKALAFVSKMEFGKMEVHFDVTLIIIAIILSFMFFGTLKGIGIGTVISALTVGRFCQHFEKLNFIKQIHVLAYN